MGNKVTFDYSKASTFVAKHEVDYMSKLAMDAKELLLSRRICTHSESGRED